MSILTRTFTASPKLLFDIIQRQAGSLQKAFLEGVMNSIEAQTSKVITTYDEKTHTLTIKDDGKGITTMKEIQDFFECFGKAHSADENVIWKQFRMGRGQMFSFGKNTWRTGPFMMKVDVKNEGLNYHLYTNQPFFNGCEITIELYRDPIGTEYSSVDMMKNLFRKQVRFMSTPVLFNGEQLNTPPNKCKWTFEDDHAYYLFGVGNDMTIYNLGAYTMAPSATTVGVTGLVVSKQMLKVNFARNDIQSDCPLWLHIWKVIKENKIKKIRKESRRLQDYERISTLRDFRDQQIDYDDIKQLGLIPLVNDRVLSLSSMQKNSQFWTFTERGNRQADRIMQTNSALCIDKSLLEVMDYNENKSEFFDWLIRRAGFPHYKARKWSGLSNLYRDFEELSIGSKETFNLIPQLKLTLAEKRLLKILNSSMQEYWDGRVITIGASDTFDGWTDGKTYIALNRQFLNKMSFVNGYACARLFHLLAHEMSHDTLDVGTHIHATEFYMRFHEYTEKSTNRSSNSLFAFIPSLIYAWRNGKIEERSENAIKREKRKEQQVEKKLGIAV